MKRLGELKPGDVFKNNLGEFIVLCHENDQTKVLMKNFYEEDVEFGDSCNYLDSKLKIMCDEEIAHQFITVFGDALIEHEVNLISVDMQPYGTFECKVRPMTFDEVREFNDLIVDKNLPDWWWTCTPWSTAERGWRYLVAVVSPSGRISDCNCRSCSGVRPFCILKSDIFVSLEE